MSLVTGSDRVWQDLLDYYDECIRCRCGRLYNPKDHDRCPCCGEENHGRQ